MREEVWGGGHCVIIAIFVGAYVAHLPLVIERDTSNLTSRVAGLGYLTVNRTAKNELDLHRTIKNGDSLRLLPLVSVIISLISRYAIDLSFASTELQHNGVSHATIMQQNIYFVLR